MMIKDYLLWLSAWLAASVVALAWLAQRLFGDEGGAREAKARFDALREERGDE